MKKKGQAAMEFLMTYGWAILVVLIAIGSLGYFGILDMSRFLPENCTLITGLGCVDFKVTTSEITLVVQNGMGAALYDVNISVGDCKLECEGCFNPIDSGGKTTWKNYCLQKLGRFKEIIFIDYKKGESPITRNKQGEIITKVEVGDFYNFEDLCEVQGGNYTNSIDFGDSAIPYCWFLGSLNMDCDTVCSNKNLICADEDNNWDDNNCDLIKYYAQNELEEYNYGCWCGDIDCGVSNASPFMGALPPDNGGGLNRDDSIPADCSSLAGWRICPCVIEN